MWHGRVGFWVTWPACTEWQAHGTDDSPGAPSDSTVRHERGGRGGLRRTALSWVQSGIGIRRAAHSIVLRPRGAPHWPIWGILRKIILRKIIFTSWSTACVYNSVRKPNPSKRPQCHDLRKSRRWCGRGRGRGRAGSVCVLAVRCEVCGVVYGQGFVHA